jgi:hypothetical protein
MELMTYRSPPNLLPRQLPARSSRNDNLALAIKTHDFHSDRAGSTTLNLVLMTEEVDSRLTAAVIQSALDKDTEHSTFARINYHED